MKNINTKEYWDSRFKSSDWALKGGNNQSLNFAEEQVKHLPIDSSFTGKILDFGCAEGDAFPIYKKEYPNADLYGIDLSEFAINSATKRYGEFAQFLIGDDNLLVSKKLSFDIIICSNVFEHLSDYKDVLGNLLKISPIVIIVTPFNEYLNPLILNNEHINSFDESTFLEFNSNYKIYVSKGWSEYGKELFIDIYIKNIFRLLSGRRLRKRAKQIMYQIER